jgi:hypothetical protein
VVADGAFAIGAGNVDGLPGKVDVFEELGDALQARLDHGCGSRLQDGSEQVSQVEDWVEAGRTRPLPGRGLRVSWRSRAAASARSASDGVCAGVLLVNCASGRLCSGRLARARSVTVCSVQRGCRQCVPSHSRARLRTSKVGLSLIPIPVVQPRA